MADDRRILRVGLTGNIGAGKSTVGAMLQEHGFLLLDADRFARELLEEDPTTIAAIARELGPELVDDGGRIDRRALAALVFRDPDARATLEALTHPGIRALEAAAVARWEVARGVAVTEAALLVETGGAARYDRLVVVTCDDPIRLERLQARGMERSDALLRMRAQMEQSAKAATADYVVDNSGERSATRARVDEVAAALERDLDER